MQHLIIVSHPAPQSLTMGLVHAYASELETLGHRQQIYDLYRRGFNPVLTAHELTPVSTDQPSDSDLAQAQEDIRAADVLTVVYPLWWASMPAMLKGYIDWVFARGFAYESHGGVVRGLLSGKQCILITISGAPLPLLVETGQWQAVQALQDTHIFRSAGFELLEHLHFDAVEPNLPRERAHQHLARVRSCARAHFSPPSA